MVRVRFIVEQLGPKQSVTIKLIRDLTCKSIADIKNSVVSKTPIYEGPLFPRQGQFFASTLASTLESLEKAGAIARVYLLPQSRSSSPGMVLTASILRTMAESSEIERQRQLNLAFSEADQENDDTES